MQALFKLIIRAEIPEELESYKAAISDLLQNYMNVIQVNFKRLALGKDEILEELLSDTQQVIYIFRIITDDLAAPLLRSSDADKLCLRFIQWIHLTHHKTFDCPAAITNGNVSILPRKGLPLYYFPCVEQRNLLHLPLFLHEFGHELYLYHKREMDDLVSELRRDIADLLIPASLRNDRHSEHQAAKRQSITDVWYDWMQEFYCDAVGLIMGGPCFLKSFSTFLSPLRQVDFYRQPEHLIAHHPVTLLRVRFLVKRASSLGYVELAQTIEKEWLAVAEASNIQEDYHGFYDDILEHVVDECLENMLVETDPRPCTDDEVIGQDWHPETDTPIRLLNWAWQVYEQNPSEYFTWEAEKIPLFSTVDKENHLN